MEYAITQNSIVEDLVNQAIRSARLNRVVKDVERQELIGRLESDSRLRGYKPLADCIAALSHHWISDHDLDAFEREYRK